MVEESEVRRSFHETGSPRPPTGLTTLDSHDATVTTTTHTQQSFEGSEKSGDTVIHKQLTTEDQLDEDTGGTRH